MDNQTPEMIPTTPQTPNNGKAYSIAGLVCGIVATVLAWFYLVNIVALAAGIVGLICAVNGRKKAKLTGAPSGIATAGLVLAIIGTSLAGIGFLSCTLCVLCVAGTAGSVASGLNSMF